MKKLKADYVCKISCSGPLWGFVVGFMLFNIKGIACYKESRGKLVYNSLILTCFFFTVPSLKKSPYAYTSSPFSP